MAFNRTSPGRLSRSGSTARGLAGYFYVRRQAIQGGAICLAEVAVDQCCIVGNLSLKVVEAQAERSAQTLNLIGTHVRRPLSITQKVDKALRVYIPGFNVINFVAQRFDWSR